jgi:DNA polymerase-3 subunit chi
MQIDFYVLATTSGQQSLLFACQLVEKAHAKQQHVYIHTNSLPEAEKIDALLWTYQDTSFLPHALYQPNDDNPPPIQIGTTESLIFAADNKINQSTMLINLATKIPTFYAQFTHIAEIVFSEPAIQQLARERYKQYREQGHEINTIKISA